MVSQFKYSSALDFGLVVKFQKRLPGWQKRLPGKGEDPIGSGRKTIYTLCHVVIKKY